MSKGSRKRPRQVSKEEEQLRWLLLRHEITKDDFDKELEKIKNELKS